MALTAMTPIAVSDVTNAVRDPNTGIITGTGAFDVFMLSMKKFIDTEYDLNRINSDQYPTVFLGAMQTALTQAVTFVLQKPLLERQADSETSKKTLIDRQTKGFDDDALQKLLKQALDSWSVAYSVAKDVNGIPDSIKVDSIDNIMKKAMVGLSVMQQTDTTLPVNPLGIP